MPHSEALQLGARAARDDAPAVRRKRKSRALTATEEAIFLIAAALAAIATEALVILKYSAIIE